MARDTVIEVIYSPVIGGSETLAFNLCRQWQERGIKSRVCCLYGQDGALIRRLKDARIPCDLLDVTNLPMWRRWIRVFRYVRRTRPTALHVHHLGLLINVLVPAYLAGCFRVVYTEHSAYGIVTTRWMRTTLPFVSLLVKRFTCVSKNLADVFSGLGVPRRRMRTIYSGVDIQRYRPNAVRAEVSPVLRIGAVGRLVPEKDYPTLLQALAILKGKTRFYAEIAGDGRLAQDLRAQARTLGLGDVLSFKGSCENVPAFLRELDVYVLSSRHEGLPIAVLEAMATALPVVATRITAIPEIVEDGVTGLLVEPGSPQALADALLSLAQDPRRRRQLGDAAMARVRSGYTIYQTSHFYAKELGVAEKYEAALLSGGNKGMDERG